MTLREQRDQWIRLYVTSNAETTLDLYRLLLDGSPLYSVDRRILERSAGGPIWAAQKTPWFKDEHFGPRRATCTICGWSAPDSLPNQHTIFAMLDHQAAHAMAALREGNDATNHLKVRRDQLCDAPRLERLRLRWWRVSSMKQHVDDRKRLAEQ